MPKFAAFDPAMPQPAPVLGWYDTDAFDYRTALPDKSHLIEVTAAQWENRMATPCVKAGKLTAEASAKPWPPNPA